MRQAQALQLMMDGKSVFLTGAPGSGKSYVLNKFVDQLKRSGKRAAVTASTGIAATHIGGVTIHSWSGVGIRDSLSEKDIAILSRRAPLVSRFQSTDVLVIDEVSMLSAWFLDLVNQLAQVFRGDYRPFGGMQVVLVGDMFQLPPVSRDSRKEDFAHYSSAWQELDPEICYLTEQHRQKRDGLLSILDAMRADELNEDHLDLLRSRMGVSAPDGLEPTKLYSHNVNVETINQKHLAMLPGLPVRFEMRSKGPAALVEQLTKRVLAPRILELKVGAEVMFVANDPGRSFINGSRGKVLRFEDGRPIVQLVDGGRTLAVSEHSWQSLEDEKVLAEVNQLPLRLAWAITIHKSQGMSIDIAEIDLSRSFTPGMGYVALSRLRSLDGLYITGINSMALRLHPVIHELDDQLRSASKVLESETADYHYVEQDKSSDLPVVVSPESNEDNLLGVLKRWRRERAQADSVPAYIIAHNYQLEDIARTLPLDEMSLMSIKGIGPAKFAKYGSEILSITRRFSS